MDVGKKRWKAREIIDSGAQAESRSQSSVRKAAFTRQRKHGAQAAIARIDLAVVVTWRRARGSCATGTGLARFWITKCKIKRALPARAAASTYSPRRPTSFKLHPLSIHIINTASTNTQASPSASSASSTTTTPSPKQPPTQLNQHDWS